MMAPSAKLVGSLFLLFFSSSAVAECGSNQSSAIPPSIPIKNVSLADGGVRRGLFISVGEPPQNLAFEANTTANNSYVYDGSTLATNVCANSTLEIQCTTQIGGAFNEANSQDFSGELSFAASGASAESQAGFNLWGQDVLWLNNASYKTSKLPVGLYEGRDVTTSMNDFGLGQNSTILNSLYDSGAIFSKVWSMWQGWTGANADHQIDGSLVLGGYDAARAVGANLTTPFTAGQGSTLIVDVTEIVMNFPNGTNITIFGSSTQPVSFQAQILPTAPLITVLDDIWTEFSRYAGGTQVALPNESDNPRSEGYTHFWSMLYEAADVYSGDLTFTIASELQIRIPNHQLVVPDYTINEKGQQAITNSSLADILLYDLQGINENNFPILGQPFLTSAYLMVDYDNSQFHLWQIDPNATEDLVAIGSSNCTESTPSSTGSTSSITSASNPNGAASLSGTASKHILAHAAIIGIVLGALFGLILLGFVALYFIKRRRARGTAIPMKDGSENSDEPSPARTDELDQLRRRVLELQPPGELEGGTLEPRVELDGRVVPGWELDSEQLRVELDNSHRMVEMAG